MSTGDPVRHGRFHRSVRDLIAAAGACDERAMVDLLRMIDDDLKRVLAANLNNVGLLEETLQDVHVRIFIYLRHQRFSLPDDATDATCREFLRRWATNGARNWARHVNRYGLVTTQGRYTVPGWAMPTPPPRRPIAPVMSIEGDFEGLEGEGSEDRLDRMAFRARRAHGSAKVT